MASYWIFEPRGVEPGSVAAASRAVIVRDGWSWGAFFFGPLWILWRGLWVVLLFWLAVMVAFAYAAYEMPRTQDYVGAGVTLFSLWFALEANALRAWTLGRRGQKLAGIAVGRNLAEAEQRYLFGIGKAAGPAPASASADPVRTPIFSQPPASREGVIIPPEAGMPKAASPFGDLPSNVIAMAPEGPKP